ncbi:MAG: hypothetical protein ACRD9R_02135 [Pyrinomonadaceae bacterium]
MNKKLQVFTLAAAATLASVPTAGAQTANRRGRATQQAPAAGQQQQSALRSLPASDAVLTVDVRRVLDALPRLFANDQAKLGRINDDINDFKIQTGIDPRQFERIVVGASFTQTPSGATKIEPVVVASGTFNSNALVAAARIAAASKGKVEEQKHRGKSVHVFTLNQQVSLLNLRFTELAVTALDANTIAFGKLERVRAALDAQAGTGARAAADVVALATRDPQALIGMGGNLPASLTAKLDFLNPEISRSIAAIRQFYGTVNLGDTSFSLNSVFRTETPAAARTLGDTVEGLKQLAPVIISTQLSGERARLARAGLDGTKVAVQGSEVQIKLDLPQEDFSAILRVF